MKKLEERILKEGRALSKEVLKVDSFLNHAVDAKLMYEIGEEFKKYFDNHNITRIFTIESSGIAPAVMTALLMKLPMVTLKKKTSKILNGDVYQTTVHSFTKNSDYELTLSKDYINKNDKDIKLELNTSDKYINIKLSKKYNVITPGLEKLVKSNIVVEREIYYEK